MIRLKRHKITYEALDVCSDVLFVHVNGKLMGAASFYEYLDSWIAYPSEGNGITIDDEDGIPIPFENLRQVEKAFIRLYEAKMHTIQKLERIYERRQ